MESAWGKSLFYFLFDNHFSLFYSWKFKVEMRQISLFYGHFHVMALKIEVRQGDTDLNFKLRWPKTWAGFTLISELTMQGVLIQYINLIWFNEMYEQLLLDQDYDWVLCLWKAVAGVWIACVGMILFQSSNTDNSKPSTAWRILSVCTPTLWWCRLLNNEAFLLES